MQQIQTNDLTKKLQAILPDHLVNLLRCIGELADKKKVSVYIVGGFLRDLMIGIASFDIDLVVEGDTIAFSRYLKGKLNAQLKISPRFKTTKLTLADGLIIDIAMARTESYEYPAALPKVESSSLIKDLSRRDFTINTLALGLNKKGFGFLIDPFEAVKDLKQKKIRILHDLSFVDDPTRIFRAVRFEQRFDFKIDKHTQRLLIDAIYGKLFKKLSRFRMTNELILILNEPKPIKIIRRMNTIDELDFIHPNIKLNSNLSDRMKKVEKIISLCKKYCPDKSIKQWLVYLMAIIDDLSLGDFKGFLSDFNFSKKDKTILLRMKKIDTKFLENINMAYGLFNNRSMEEYLFLISKLKKKNVKKMFTDYLVKYVNIKQDI